MPAPAEFLFTLGARDRADLEAIGHVQTAGRGDVLLSRGDDANRVIVLTQGRVKISVITSNGREAILNFRGPGALLGDQALIDESTRTASVIAVEPVEYLSVPPSSFRSYLAGHPDVALAMLVTLSGRLRETDRRFTDYVAADTLGRVCARLAELCETQGDDCEGGVRITLPITQEELAAWTGSSIESTAKALRQLRTLGWIGTGRRNIEVHDLDALRSRAP